MSTVANYFKGIVDPEAISRLKEGQKDAEDEDAVVTESLAIKDSPGPLALESVEKKKEEEAAKKILPKMKCQLSISNFRVAIVEDVHTQQPQALSLNVCV